MLMEDILNHQHIPKFDDRGDYLSIITKSYFENSVGKFEVNHTCLILKGNSVILFSEYPMEAIRKRIDKTALSNGKLTNHTADYIFFILLDTLIDTFYSYFDSLQEEILDMEEILLTDRKTDQLNSIHQINKKITSLRRDLFPLQTGIIELIESEPELISRGNMIYINDLKDHINQLIEYYYMFLSFVKNLIELNSNNLNNNTSEIMKALTIVATIFIPLSFITGVYGMNFKNMPELYYEYGYPIVMVLMFLIAAALLIFSKLKKWI